MNDPAMISGLAAADDAAIYRIADNLCLVQTVDVFTPCVDDPYLFGRICAANCLSDIYAMGGEPRTALSILAFPSETLAGEMMYQMLAGAMETLGQAGVALVGGHSIKDDEIKLGFAITGIIDPGGGRGARNPAGRRRARSDQTAGHRRAGVCEQIGRGNNAGMTAAAASMATLNKAAAEAMKAAGASACTDMTGFGLFGHLIRMARQGKLTARIYADALPAFDGALEASRGHYPRRRGAQSRVPGRRLQVAPGVDEALVNFGCDAQTSGGLLIAIAPDRLEDLKQALAQRGVPACLIGEFVGPSAGHILVTNSAAQEERGRPRPRQALEPQPADVGVRAPTAMNSSSPSDPHQPGCCADIFEAKPATASSAAETQRAFGALMRSVQTAGALSEKAKELILFSLVLHSRCHPCFDTHYQKARELGITQAELDEAAWCAIAMGGAPVRMFYQECLRRAQTGTDAKSK